MSAIRIGRIYDPPGDGAGTRILVDRLWPRGISKGKAALDLWARDVAPSDGLRRAFHAGGMPWDEFARLYGCELDANPAVPDLRRWIGNRDAVLLTATRDLGRTHARILAERLG